ncbi:hypothetical protein HAX54_049012, partial [Datura stramonium]|nr:hypothetical protein [Datura stramonium]
YASRSTRAISRVVRRASTGIYAAACGVPHSVENQTVLTWALKLGEFARSMRNAGLNMQQEILAHVFSRIPGRKPFRNLASAHHLQNADPNMQHKGPTRVLGQITEDPSA